MASKSKEAEAHIREAEKHMKTTLFKWTPDIDLAASEYEKAAQCYKTAKRMDKCLANLLKSADLYQQNRSFFYAAKNYEQAAVVSAKELMNYDSAAKYIEKATDLFREHGIPDTAALTYDRGAKMVEAHNQEKAAIFFAKAAEVSMLEGKSNAAAEYSGKSARLYVKMNNYQQAIEFLRNQLNYLVDAGDVKSCNRVVINIILVELHRGDFVAAQKAFREGKCYIDDHELYNMTLLIDSYDQMDTLKILEALNCPFLRSLDNEYAKIVRNMKEKYSGIEAAKVNTSTNPVVDDDEAGAML